MQFIEEAFRMRADEKIIEALAQGIWIPRELRRYRLDHNFIKICK